MNWVPLEIIIGKLYSNIPYIVHNPNPTTRITTVAKEISPTDLVLIIFNICGTEEVVVINDATIPINSTDIDTLLSFQIFKSSSQIDINLSTYEEILL